MEKKNGVQVAQAHSWPGPDKPQPGLEYLWCRADDLDEVEDDGWRPSSGNERHEFDGDRYRLFVRGEVIPNIHPDQISPSVVVLLPEARERKPSPGKGAREAPMDQNREADGDVVVLD